MAKLSEQINSNVVLHGDCLIELKKMPDNSVDAVVTDPPYGMSYQSSRRIDKYKKIENDNNIDWFANFVKECYRILKEDTHIYIFCNDYSISEFRKMMMSAGFKVKRTLVWVKNNHTSGDLKGDYANKTEFILFAHKGRRELVGSRDTNVLSYNRVPCDLHPTQKPIDLFEYLIAKSTKMNDTVLDPFGGSGTTAIACLNTNRNFILMEKEKEYVDIINGRVKYHKENISNVITMDYFEVSNEAEIE